MNQNHLCPAPEEIENTACAGESDTATQQLFEVGYTYRFETDGTDVIIEFELLDDKQAWKAYLWKESPSLFEFSMSKVEGQRFRANLQTNLWRVIEAYAQICFSGLAVTKYYSYTVGEKLRMMIMMVKMSRPLIQL